MAEDFLKNLPVDRVAAWYRRLADIWSSSTPELKPALAGEFLRAYLDNKDPKAKIAFDAPAHLRSSSSVLKVQKYHRDVFLTNVKGRFGYGIEKWAGVLPRLRGQPGFRKWDAKNSISLEYESLCDPAPTPFDILRVQKFGTSGERDIFGSLRGFQLKSTSTAGCKGQQGNLVNILFSSWSCSAHDRYDWNYSEYLTVVNPDYQSNKHDAIEPGQRTLTVYHSNAKRLEDAGRAAPYDILIKSWNVFDPQLLLPATVDLTRRL